MFPSTGLTKKQMSIIAESRISILLSKCSFVRKNPNIFIILPVAQAMISLTVELITQFIFSVGSPAPLNSHKESSNTFMSTIKTSGKK